MIKIELTFTSVAEAAAFLAGRTAGNDTPAATTTASPAASPASSKKPDASAKAQADKPKASAPAPAPAPADDAPNAGSVDYDTQVKPLVNTVASMGEGSGGGRAVVLALLKEFGAAKGSEVKADDLPAFKERLEAIIANESVA